MDKDKDKKKKKKKKKKDKEEEEEREEVGWYNKVNNRTGYFWGDRFKSVLIEKGEAYAKFRGEIIGKKDRNVYRTGINSNILSLRKLIC